MDEKYINLLLEKCSKIKEQKILFINYSKEIEPFIQKIVKEAKKYNPEEIYLDSYDIEEEHNILKNSSIEEIENNNYFNKSIWDTYAKKKACFLIFETEYPGLMDDIDAEKISLASKIKRESRQVYRKMVERCELSWCIAAYPGKRWANHLFKDKDSYKKLKEAIYRMCMIDKENPINEWNNHLIKQGRIQEYLNSLKIKTLHYTNSLGTNLEITLPDNYLYASALDNDIIVNMPSYEIFISPVYNKTEGIVYASKPLIYNGGLINNFWLKFKNGKVIDFDAKIGKDILKGIIESDEQSCYLGECALVEINSPIAKENFNYETTLIDENASCHLALGSGFAECIQDGLKLTDKELLNRGINISKNHVDFMIGTPDLQIEATTVTGEKIKIFENGNFSQKVISESKKCYPKYPLN